MAEASQPCSRCGGTMEQGSIQIAGHYDSKFRFVLPGTPTAWNPIEAFRQGLHGEQPDRVFEGSSIVAYRCDQCGHLEIFALDK